MSPNSLPSEILDLLVDPYAVFGISVNADERQIIKRYHALAKQLHPDNFIITNKPDQELAGVILTRLINPAYQQLKNFKNRQSSLAQLQNTASSLSNKAIASLKNAINLDITEMSVQETEFFYEKAIASYASAQYRSLQESHQITKRIHKLNLFYLSFRSNANVETQTITEEESTSIVPVPEVKVPNLKLSSQKKSPEPVINYAQRHYERAVQYQQQAQWALAVQELRDAIKIEPNNSDHYALLGVVHLQQNFPGMAKVYIRQALKLNPKHPLAVKYATILKIETSEQSHPKSMAKALSIASLLSKFLSGKD